jgi:CRISPR-associated endonuclease/helicase Cas3
MSVELHQNEFAAFFEAVHGCPAFPWQVRLAQTVIGKGWPRALDVPTGAGKTAAIDVAVFHLALEADRKSARQAPLRILFVVDRRLIVDDAYTRACKIAKAVDSARDGILARVAGRLRHFAEDGQSPLAVSRLRGGVPKEPDWVRTPAQPTVVISTVDQVGSRMLFRGYGVSDTMKPIHAGLLGSDALLLLDEAHLSHPFVQTARDTRMFQERGAWSADTARAPFAIVTLSATQTDACEPLLGEDDREDPTLGPRLKRGKPAELVKSDTTADERAFAAEFAAHAWTLSKTGGGSAAIVAVVVNRVKRARAVFKALQGLGAGPFTRPGTNEVEESISDGALADLALLIGRARALDREELLADLLPRIRAGRPQQENDRPLFIIATQCIEAGADLDFDALVTEIAPLDCLRQRFGRLNRMGRDIDARAVILAASDQVAKSAKPDLIYGEAMKQTWALLQEKSHAVGRGKSAESLIDFGVEASAKWIPDPDALKDYVAPRAEAPVLLPRDVALWSRTWPVPIPDPEVSLFLHGPNRGPGDVQIVWRSDLGDDVEFEDGDVALKEKVSVCPPSVLETLAVPIGEARRWLQRNATGNIADVEAAEADDAREARQDGARALRWRGSDDAGTRLVTANDVRPGDLLVVHARRGGCDRWGWAPDLADEVTDLGEEANEKNRGRLILRLSPLLLKRALSGEGLDDEACTKRSRRFDDLLERLKEIPDRDVVGEIGGFPGLPAVWRERLGRLDRGPIVSRGADGQPLAIEARRRTLQHTAQGGEAVTEDDGSAVATETPVRLDTHCTGVRDRARSFAEQIGLDATLVDDIALAGFLHDAGKAHPAFRRLLYGGAELAAIGSPPLAKSTRLPGGRRAWADACQRAGFPLGARHEVASLVFAEVHPKFVQAHDPELVLWLIGTHHGYGRPFFPPVDWPTAASDAIEANLGDGVVKATPTRSLAELTARWVDLFAHLQARYGPWRLAHVEAILRLADHRQSEAEQARSGQAGDAGRAEDAA